MSSNTVYGRWKRSPTTDVKMRLLPSRPGRPAPLLNPLNHNIFDDNMESSPDRLSIANGKTEYTVPKLDGSKYSDDTAKASLDSLSVELKVAILQFLPDTQTLRALVRSSSLYHGAYAAQRQRIFSAVLLRDLGPEIFLEALSLHEASMIPWGDPTALSFRSDRKERVETLIAHYKTQRETPSRFSYRTLDLDTLGSLAAFHKIVADTTADFCCSRLSRHPYSSDKIHSYDEPSDSERLRIYRSMYRFQLFNTLFDMPLGRGWPSDGSDPSPFDSRDMSDIFLSLYNPWEVEEISCIYDYLVECYASLFDLCRDFIVEFRPDKEESLKSIQPSVR